MMKSKETTNDGLESPPKKGFVRIQVYMTEQVEYKFTRDISETQLVEFQQFAKDDDDDAIAEFLTTLKDPLTDAVNSLDPEVNSLYYLQGEKLIEI